VRRAAAGGPSHDHTGRVWKVRRDQRRTVRAASEDRLEEVVRAALRAAYAGTAVPLQEGKTAKGQMKKIRLYHTISAAPDTLASATTGTACDFGLWKGRRSDWRSRSPERFCPAISKSPGDPAANSAPGGPLMPYLSGISRLCPALMRGT
jgi:hypothetical protein